jgi:RNA polymerase sigma-70 factor (ECF subfamily)
VDESPFTAVDRDLLRRCLNREPGSWNDFVDRFLSLIYHTIGYTAHLRSARLVPEDVEDIAAEVLLQIVADNFKVLRDFRKESSLATYLTVIARRICVHELVRRQKVRDAIKRGDSRLAQPEPDDSPAAHRGMERLEEVEKLLRRLRNRREREIVRLYYLEGRSYEEISTELDVPVNTIGAILSRARKKLREMAAPSTTTMTAIRDEPKPPARPAANIKPAPAASIKPTKPTRSKPKVEAPPAPQPEAKSEARPDDKTDAGD